MSKELRVDSLSYTLKVVDKKLRVGCQRITRDDVVKIRDFIDKALSQGLFEDIDEYLGRHIAIDGLQGKLVVTEYGYALLNETTNKVGKAYDVLDVLTALAVKEPTKVVYDVVSGKEKLVLGKAYNTNYYGNRSFSIDLERQDVIGFNDSGRQRITKCIQQYGSVRATLKSVVDFYQLDLEIPSDEELQAQMVAINFEYKLKHGVKEHGEVTRYFVNERGGMVTSVDPQDGVRVATRSTLIDHFKKGEYTLVGYKREVENGLND